MLPVHCQTDGLVCCLFLLERIKHDYYNEHKNMWIEYIIIELLAYFVSSHLAKMCAFRVVQPGDRPIFIIFAIQTFTVIWQVAFASVISVFHGHGFTANFIPDYLTTYCKNFILAFPLQLIFVGPLARFIFRMLFISRKKEKNMAEIQNDDEQILDEVM